MQRPDPSEYDPYFQRYIDLVPETDIVTALEAQAGETQQLIASLDDERAMHRYAPGKWTIKGVLGHVGDAEKMFGYRFLAIARGETNSLPSFDENVYATHADFESWPLRDLADSLALMRRANLLLMRNLSEDGWNRRGIANGKTATPRSIAFITLGHERHHLRVLNERYLT